MTYAREKLSSDTDSYCAVCVLFENLFSQDDIKVQFILDPSVIPEVIAAGQTIPGTLEQILDITTTWCHSLNKARNKLLGN